MNTLSKPGGRLVLAAAVAAALLGACASAPSRNSALDEARAGYQRAAADTQVVRTAPVELRRAQQALQQAEEALRAGRDASTIEHYAYLARQRTEVAVHAAKTAHAEQAVAEASQRRDGILIDSRTREADQQRALAEKARLAAEAQRNQAEAARKQAEAAHGQAEAARKLAEERLATAQAAQAKTAAANARAKTLQEQVNELKAKQTPRGMVLTLGDVLFDTGRSELNPGAARALDQLATFLREHPARTVEIEGYTDSVGSDQTNQTLSERRANAVKNALMDRGIVSNRISARGFGPASPVASNNNAAGRQQNRRVEIVISGTT